jgi:S-adenosylmethionine hydrolase
MLCPIITLLSDFGLKASYVAEMKAAILSLSREVQIIDSTRFGSKSNKKKKQYALCWQE